MNIKYLPVKAFIGWKETESFVKQLILKNKIISILEIGAGANPTINSAFIHEHNLNYTISDIDDTELQKADDIYSKLVADFSSKVNIPENLILFLAGWWVSTYQKEKLSTIIFIIY